jgi:hypothetical protein
MTAAACGGRLRNGLESARRPRFADAVFLAVIRQAAEAASNANGPFHGYPPWLIVLVGALVAAVAIWIFAKLLKWTLWIAILVVLIGGVILAAKMLTGQ